MDINCENKTLSCIFENIWKTDFTKTMDKYFKYKVFPKCVTSDKNVPIYPTCNCSHCITCDGLEGSLNIKFDNNPGTEAYEKEVDEIIQYIQNNNLFYWASYYLPWNIIKNRPNLPWIVMNVCSNASVTWDTVCENPDFDWDIYSLSSNPNITFDIVRANPEPWETIQRLRRQRPASTQSVAAYWKKWNYFALTYHTPVDTILENIDHDWDFSWLSGRVPLSTVLAHPEIEWAMYELSSSKHIHLSDVLAHPEIRWDFECLTDNPNITMDDIMAHTELPWEMEAYSSNENVTLETIMKYPDYAWDYNVLSENPNIPISYILQTPEKKWNYEKIIYFNNTVTIEILEKWFAEKKIKSKIDFLNIGLFERSRDARVQLQNAHYANLREVHRELIDVVFDPDNSWYFENLK